MKLNGLFRILSILLLGILSALSYKIFRGSSPYLFYGIELLILLTAVYLFVFYKFIIKPIQAIGNGMELLKEQDFSSRLRLVGQPEADRIIGIFNQMMEQLKNERLHLREQNHFLDLLVNASPLGVIVMDLDNRILSVNPAAYRLAGIPPSEEINGKTLKATDNPFLSELLEIKKNTAKIIRLSDANIYKCTHSSFIDKGFPHSFYLIEFLTEEVLRAEMKAYEKVIRMIAHEVNNSVAGITSTLDTLDVALREMENVEEISMALRLVIERFYSMNRFITRFTDVVRIPEPQLREQNLNALVVAGKHFMETICHDRNIRIVMELSEISPIVKIDILLFEQVLLNIIKNSAESIEQEGTIYIRTIAKPLCLEIADTGKGISKEVEAKLFSPFFSTKPKGQGLGLIFIREVLLKHGHRFSLRTYPDGLTRFKIFPS